MVKRPLLIAAVVLATLAIGRTAKAGEEPLIEGAFEETITGYCSCEDCCGKSDGVTFSGVPAREGICASSNSEYYGKLIIVYNDDWSVYGYYECLDKGPDHIDIWFNSHEEALKFGKQIHYIKVVEGVG